MFFRCLTATLFIVVGNMENVRAADVNCPTNSTYNGSECVCDSGYTKTSHVYDFNVKNPTYSYSGSTFTAEATNIGTIYGESLGWDKGTGSIDASVPAGTYTGKNCWCRIVAPFETNWTYSGGAVAPSSTIPEGSNVWFDECSKKCAGKTYSATIRSFYGTNILNNGEICVLNTTTTCSDGYYWDENANECKFDYEAECENRGGYYYWDTETQACKYNYESECEDNGGYYYWDTESQTCKYDYESECVNNGELYYWENGECKNHRTECDNRGGYYYWDTESQTCRYDYESECNARGDDYTWNGINQECEHNISVPSLSCEDGVVENASSYYPTSELPSVQEISTDVYYSYNGEEYQLLTGSSSSFNLKSAQSAGNAGEGTAIYDQYMAELDYYTSDQGWSVDFNGVTVNGWAVCAANAWKTRGDIKTGVLTGTYGGCSCSLDKKRWVVYGNIVSGYSGNWTAKNEYCRKNCPALCAEMVANDQEFRKKVFNDSCDAVGGNGGGGTITPVICTTNQFAYENECIDAKFNISTNSINYFEFRISASGRFYVDWGDGNVTEYIKTDKSSLPIYHTYSDTKSRTIRIGGLADGYSTSVETAAISFANWSGQTNTYNAIEYISGSLAKIFPTIDNGDSLSTQPRFWRTFNGCTNLKGSLDEDLFAELRGQPVEHMFYSTFMGCENITGPIPEHFFGNISGQPASYMFDGTFSGCKNLGSENGVPTYSIPENLFANIRGTTVPHMFPGTFFNCKSLTGEIPHNLFANISGEPKERIFAATFSGCENLSGQIPQDLFANISGSLENKSFRRTFKDTYSLSGWVPENLFANLDNDDHQGDGMLNIFENSGIVTACPEYYYQVETEFDEFWDGRVSCRRCPNGLYSEYGSVGESSCHVTTYECYAGEYLYVGQDVTECRECPIGYYCPQGVWTIENADESKILCPNGTTSASGTMDEYGCVPSPFELDVKPYTPQFVFRISAAGTYIINWGDGNIEQIRITTPEPTRIEHNYANYMSGETYTISIGSKNVSEYYIGDSDYYGAITFGMVKNSNETNTYDRIIAIRGSLGAVFPTIGNGDSLSTQPRFANTFNNCDKITTPIPENIFEGVHGAPVDYMFYRTFAGCTGITGEITENLFADISGETREAMFSNTFYNCQNIESEIPANLFAGIYGSPKIAMYSNTFNGCKKLYGNIPSGLFGNISGNPAINMYSGTFDGCENLTGEIPDGLFGDIYGDAQGWMYYGTFYGCTNLSGYVPKNLFGRLSGEPEWMMFYQTFYNDSQIVGFKDYNTNTTYGFIPTDLFGTINNVNYDDTNMSMFEMFEGTSLITKCPIGYYKYNTGFESDLNPKVSCTKCPDGSTTLYDGANSESECLYNAYNITYDYTNGGSGCENEAVNIGMGKEILCEPVKEGYNFIGWYDSANGGEKITYISEDNSQDIVLYAHWVPLCSENENWNGEECVCKNGYIEIDIPWTNNYKIDADDYEPYQTVHPDTYEEMRDAMRWRATFDNVQENREMAGIVIEGDAFCSADASRNIINGNATSGSDILDELTGTGQYCWCRMGAPALSRWVYVADIATGGLEGCQRRCPGYCGSYISGVTVKQSVVRKAIYDNILSDNAKVCVPEGYNNNPIQSVCETEKYLRIGNNESDKMCLSEEQLTHPALAVEIGGKTYYVNMGQQNLTINSESSKKMHVLYNNNTYNVYDASAE